MSLFWHVPGFPSYKNDTQEGDAQFFKDRDDATGKSRFLVIDGGTPTYANILIKDLKMFGAHAEGSEVRLALSHSHYDHIKGLRILINHKTNKKYTFNITTLYCYDPASLKSGLRDNKGSGYVRSDIQALEDTIKEIKARGGTTINTTRVSRQLFKNMAMLVATIITAPQARSSRDQPMVSARRWVSLVTRLSRYPTGMRS